MGRDHCIYATEAGYVRYYRDPRKHPQRQYIGTVFEKDGRLPHPPNAARRRRLNMYPVRREPASDAPLVTSDLQVVSGANGALDGRVTPREIVPARPVRHKHKGYAIKQTNWWIGRAAERQAFRRAKVRAKQDKLNQRAVRRRQYKILDSSITGKEALKSDFKDKKRMRRSLKNA